MTHGLSRPYCSICARACSIGILGLRLGSSGSPVISITVHNVLALVQALYSGPVVCVGFPACTMCASFGEPEKIFSATGMRLSG